ncbi:four helix bundle protein [Patescibacteria group bacterium]|nr:four helix bundle protein [Patescibacteria group bacterium]
MGKKDFIHRLRISRKEAKETSYWLEIILEANPEFKQQIQILIRETQELRNIISAIISKAKI